MSAIPTPQRHHLDKRADALAEQGAGAPDDLLSERPVADWLGVSSQWMQIGRHRGFGPSFLRIGRRIRYRRADVLAWLAERTHRSTAEYTQPQRKDRASRRSPSRAIRNKLQPRIRS